MSSNRPGATDTEPNDPGDSPTPPPGGGNKVKDSAQQIWLAGLGAFAKAQEEGSKVFEALVKEGLGMQRKTQAAATEATEKMASMASGATARPAGPWDKLENIFEDRVAKALGRLGMPSAEDIQALIGRVESLERQLDAAGRAPEAAASGAEEAPPDAAATPAKSRKTPSNSAPATPRQRAGAPTKVAATDAADVSEVASKAPAKRRTAAKTGG